MATMRVRVAIANKHQAAMKVGGQVYSSWPVAWPPFAL